MGQVKQSKKNVKTKQKLNINLDESPKGFRKGITKRDLISSLSDEDWVRLDQQKKAESLYVEDKDAYWLYLQCDQLKQQLDTFKEEIYKATSAILKYNNIINKHNIDIAKGETKTVNDYGIPLTMEDLKAEIVELHSKALEAKRKLLVNLFNTYVYVGRLGLDKKPLFTKEEFKNILKDVKNNLEGTPYQLENQ